MGLTDKFFPSPAESLPLHFLWPERSTSNSSVPILLSAPALGGKDYHQQTALLGLACGDSWEYQPFLKQALLSEEGVWAQIVCILFLCWYKPISEQSKNITEHLLTPSFKHKVAETS